MATQTSFLKKQTEPLAQMLRPRILDDIIGQDHLVKPGTIFRKIIEQDSLGSCIFWGPPGSGKTTLANVIAKNTKRKFVSFNASFNGIKDIKKIVDEAKKQIEFGGKNTILFVDEIHRFNKAQQDAFLQPIENGTIILIGATTENPSFEVNSALLSRCSVYLLNPLKSEDLKKIINNTIEYFNTNLHQVVIDDKAKDLLINYSNGDARIVLNVLEIAIGSVKGIIKNCQIITEDIIKQILKSRNIAYDKNGEEHYNLISALHKSLRGSDVQASLYWLARMILGGADPLYIVRRLVRFASEDIGLADPQALVQAVAVQQAVHFVGYPECDIALAQCVVYLATAPKSNKIYTAIGKAKRDIMQKPNESVPFHIRNAPTKLMQDVGYGKSYKYDHNYENNFSGQSFLPKALQNQKYYEPRALGFEKEIKKRLDYWNNLKNKLNI